jgi:hypothetical protein
VRACVTYHRVMEGDGSLSFITSLGRVPSS